MSTQSKFGLSKSIQFKKQAKEVDAHHSTNSITTRMRLQQASQQKNDFDRINSSFQDLKEQIDDASDDPLIYRKLSHTKAQQYKDQCAISSRECFDHPKLRSSYNTDQNLTHLSNGGQHELYEQSSSRITPVQPSQYLQPLQSVEDDYDDNGNIKNKNQRNTCEFCDGKSPLADLKRMRTLVNTRKEVMTDQKTRISTAASTSRAVNKQCCVCKGIREKSEDMYNPLLESPGDTAILRIRSSSQRMKVSQAAVVNSIFNISVKARLSSENYDGGPRTLSASFRRTSTNNTSQAKSMNSTAVSKKLFPSQMNSSYLPCQKLLNSSLNFNSHRSHSNSLRSSVNNTPRGSDIGYLSNTQGPNWMSEASKNMHVDQHDQVLVNSVGDHELSKLKASTESIHSFSIDEILDLFELKCQDNSIEYIPDQAMQFIAKFQKSCKHRELRLSDLSLGPLAAGLLSNVLKRNDHFARLFLDSNSIASKGASYLSEMLSVNRSLVHVDLSGNNIGPEGFESLFRALISNESLISLDVASKDGLNRNRIGLKGSIQLQELLQSNTSLLFLNIASTQLSNEQLSYICKGISEGKSLMTLNLASNDLDALSAETIIKSIQNTDLKELFLQSNKISDAGLIHLEALGRHSRHYILETLDLSNNKLTALGVIPFLESIIKNQALHKLYLNDNRFFHKEINKITEFIWDNYGLTHLSLNRCEIQVEGIESIFRGLEKNKTLTHLYLSHNKVFDKAAITIAEVIRQKSHLQVSIQKYKWGRIYTYLQIINFFEFR